MASILTASGTKFYLGPQVTEDVDTAAEYASKSYVEVKGITNYGDLGDEAAAVTSSEVGDGRVRKAKGAYDAGTLALTVNHKPQDPGQLALIAAAQSNKDYAIKIVLPDAPTDEFTNTTIYFRGLVMSRRLTVGGNDTVLSRAFSIGVNSEIIEVAPVDSTP